MQLVLLQCDGVVSDLSMFSKLRTTLLILLLLQCLSDGSSLIIILTTFNFFILMFFNIHFLSDVQGFGTSFLTILATKSSLDSFRIAAFQWISPLWWYKHPDTFT